MKDLEITHDILIAGSDFDTCRQRVKRFFDRTTLIRYDEVLVIENESTKGTEENFRARIQQGLQANQQVLGDFLKNLKEEGFLLLDDLQGLEKGYLSKVLHTIAHLKDGFIGIDSRFYNLEEDSHGVSRDLLQKITASPNSYWVLKTKGRLRPASEDPLDALRTFEGRGSDHD